MSVEVTPHDWSKEALLAKAQRYAEVMLEQQRDEWQFGFWSSLVLEHLVRAAVANISPALLADGKDWNNIYYALGHAPTTPKFQPRSAKTSDLLTRLAAILPEFTRELLNFSVEHINRRNEELHSGACPYDSFGTASWQPKFYAACEVLLKAVGMQLKDLLGEEEARAARTQIASLTDAAAKAVKGTISAYAAVWKEKGSREREALAAQALAWATRHDGHRVVCPACGSQAFVTGTPQAPPVTKVEGDLIVERQAMLPALFQCVACELKIAGFSKLQACGLGDTFTATSRYDATQYFGEPDDEYDGPEPDYNEDDL